MAMPSAGTRTPKNAGGRGGQRDSMGVERPQRSEARPRLIPLRGREGRDRLSPTRQTTSRRTPAPWLARSACDLAPAMWVVTLGPDRLRAWGASRVGPRVRDEGGGKPTPRTNGREARGENG